MTAVNPRELAAVIDQTLLKPNVGEWEARAWIDAHVAAGFASLCVAPVMVPWAADALAGSPTKVCTVVAFPLGYALSASKADEAGRLLAAGAVEIDMVMNVGAAIGCDWHAVESDVRSVVETVVASGVDGALTKVILETGYLTAEQIAEACCACLAAGAEFVKTSTGFGPRGASADDVRIMRATVGPDTGVKAAGGIRTLESALEMIEAGATRIGTSAGLAIVAAAEGKAAAAAAG